MKGRAYRLLTEFQDRLSGAQRSFVMSRLILKARVVPEAITPELDDADLEVRLSAAIDQIHAQLLAHSINRKARGPER
jgi:hypothetical protein